jgi:hypothetical protein
VSGIVRLRLEGVEQASGYGLNLRFESPILRLVGRLDSMALGGIGASLRLGHEEEGGVAVGEHFARSATPGRSIYSVRSGLALCLCRASGLHAMSIYASKRALLAPGVGGPCALSGRLPPVLCRRSMRSTLIIPIRLIPRRSFLSVFPLRGRSKRR